MITRINTGVMALTVCQPWAWGIFYGGKDIENRSWPTGYRGPLVIHAGKSRGWLGSLRPSDYPGCPEVPPNDSLVYGAIVGVVEMWDCVKIGHRLSCWAEGPWCWRLRNQTPICPIPRSGSQGLWCPTPEEVEAINRALKVAA